MNLKIIRYFIVIFFTVLFVYSCSNTAGTDNNLSNYSQPFVSQKINGKLSVDHATSEELKIMENTIENFTQMIKRQPNNAAAYNEYGNLLENHITRINNYYGLDENSKTQLCKNLNHIRDKIPILQQNDVGTAAIACKDIGVLFSKIDSTFAFRN